jgi:hypothetical protein
MAFRRKKKTEAIAPSYDEDYARAVELHNNMITEPVPNVPIVIPKATATRTYRVNKQNLTVSASWSEPEGSEAEFQKALFLACETKFGKSGQVDPLRSRPDGSYDWVR